VGGLAGHLMHLYDNPGLSFGQIKDVLVKASGGELLGTEKIDGINMFLSFSNKEGKAKAARNKGNIKTGGLDINGLIAKFSDNPQLAESFKEAMDSWQKSISQLHPNVRKKIFGDDADIYYNVEILEPSNPNVVKYDVKSIILHKVGHAFYDKQSGQVKDVDVSENYNLLNSAIDKVQTKKERAGSFKVVNSAIQTLKSLDDKKPLQNAIARLDKLQQTTGIDDNSTIGDFITKRVAQLIDKQIPGLSPAVIRDITTKIIGTGGLRIDKILAKTPDKQKDKVKAIANNPSEVLKKVIFPLEDIIHDFSVEILKGFQSTFILDNDKEVKRLQGEVSQAIKSIEHSGHQDAIAILQQQLKKLKNAENVMTASEGFVFTYDGNTYKFTGNFAPVNQILGMFKYGRGKIPPLKHLVKESDKNRIIAILPGSFKPPHIGHYLGAKYLSDIPNIDEVRVVISPKSRFDSSKKMEITANQSLKIWKIYTQNEPKIKIMISRVGSPVTDVYNTISELNPGDTLVLGLGEKDSNDSRFKRAQEWSDKNNLGVKVSSINTDVGKYSNVSATKVRDLIAANDKNNFYKLLPTHLSTKEKEQIWMILTNNIMKEHIVKRGDKYCLLSKKSDKNLGCYDSKSGAEQREKQVQYFKHINEMSSGGGGSIEVSPMARKNDDENMIDRKKFIAEMALRETIRKLIKNINVSEEKIFQTLREHIRKQIVLEKKNDVDNMHSSTGINILEDLLKKIIPQLEQDYKSLTSNIEQRKSFRAHILNAVSKTLTTADINQDAGDGMMAASPESDASAVDEEQINVDVGSEQSDGQDSDVDFASDSDSSKFISIKNRKKRKDAQKHKDFTIPGQNETGRNMSIMTYDKIEKNILDSYNILSDNEDQKVFYDYLLTNLKLYFDKFESEMSSQIEEPQVDATNNMDAGDVSGSEEVDSSNSSF